MRWLGTILVSLMIAVAVPCALAQDEAAEVPEATGPPPEAAPKATSLRELLERAEAMLWQAGDEGFDRGRRRPLPLAAQGGC